MLEAGRKSRHLRTPTVFVLVIIAFVDEHVGGVWSCDSLTTRAISERFCAEVAS